MSLPCASRVWLSASSELGLKTDEADLVFPKDANATPAAGSGASSSYSALVRARLPHRLGPSAAAGHDREDLTQQCYG